MVEPDINASLPCHSSNYTDGRGGKPIQYIFVHYTASQASAKKNAIYFSRAGAGASAHYFLDGTGTIYQSVRTKDTAWSVGNFDLNQRSLSIEVVSDGRDFSDAEINELAWLTKKLMSKHGVPNERVLRHYDAVDVARTGRTIDPHKRCPAPYIDRNKWENLKKRITGTKEDTMEPHNVWEYAYDGSVNCFTKLHGLPETHTIWEYSYNGSQNCFSALHGTYAKVSELIDAVNALSAKVDTLLAKTAPTATVDTNAIARAVSDAVSKKLKSIRLILDTDIPNDPR